MAARRCDGGGARPAQGRGVGRAGPDDSEMVELGPPDRVGATRMAALATRNVRPAEVSRCGRARADSDAGCRHSAAAEADGDCGSESLTVSGRARREARIGWPCRWVGWTLGAASKNGKTERKNAHGQCPPVLCHLRWWKDLNALAFVALLTIIGPSTSV